MSLEIANITAEGRRAISNDTQSLDVDQRLMLEIMNRVVDVTPVHLIEMFNELRAAFGGSEKALLAVKAGEVKFELVERKYTR